MAYSLKIILAGEGACGKTSLIRRFVDGKFQDDYLMTIGTKVSKKPMMSRSPVTGEVLNAGLIIWDIAGQKKFAKIHNTYYAGAKGRLLVFDLSREETMFKVNDWLKAIDAITGPIPTVIIGNKVDLLEEGDPGPPREVAGFPSDIPVVYTSAKTGAHVEEAFQYLADACVSNAEMRK